MITCLTRHLTRHLTPGLLAGLIILTAAGQAQGRQSLLIAGAGCFAAWLALSWANIQRREVPFLVSAALTSGLVVSLVPDAAHRLAAAVLQGTGFAALILAVGFLQGPADRAPLMRRAGDLLIRQPPGRRYIALSGGGFLMATVLNLGAMSLLASLLRRSNTLDAAGGDPRVQEIRERRMATALLRGFSGMPLWAPTSVSISIILTLVPGVEWAQIAPAGLALAVGWIGTGWLLDRLSWPAPQRHRPVLAPARHGAARVLMPLCAIILALTAAIFITKLVTGWGLSTAVMILIPLAAGLWFFVLTRRFGTRRGLCLAGRGLWRHCAHRLPRARYEAVMLFSAGVIGANIAALVPPDAVRALLDAVHLTGWPLLAVLITLIVLAAHIGLGPIVPIVLFVPPLLQILPPPVPPTALAFAAICGWALGVGAAPFSASLLILAGTLGRPPRLVGWIWNGRYALMTYALTLAALAVLLGVTTR